MMMDLSRGSPGTICQWLKADMEKAWPWVCVRRSVSNPKLSMAGMKACPNQRWVKEDKG